MIRQSLNPLLIGKDHFATLVDERSTTDLGKPAISRPDQWFHGVVPLLVAAATWWMSMTLTTAGAGLLITALSVFVGLLFNVLVLATSLKVANPNTVQHAVSRRLSRMVLTNVEFAICTAFMSIIVLLPLTMTCSTCTGRGFDRGVYLQWATPLVVALLASFVLTLLLVIRRMHAAAVVHFNALEEEEQAKGGSLTDRILREKGVA